MVAPSFMQTQIDIIKSDRVAQRVAQILPPEQPPMKAWREEAQKKPMPDRWIAEALQQRLEGKPARGSNITNSTWTGRSHAAAASDSSPLVNNLRQDVARLEAKMAQGSATMGSRHPEMMRMSSELAAMKNRLSEESARVGISAAQSAEAAKARERELQSAIGEQKQKVLAMSRQRAELNLLKSDVDSAQKAFDTVTASAA